MMTLLAPMISKRLRDLFDPIALYRARSLSAGLVDESALDAIEAEEKAAMKAILQDVLSLPMPDPSEVLKYRFVEEAPV